MNKMTNSYQWSRSHIACIAKNLPNSQWSTIFAYILNSTPLSSRADLLRYANNLIDIAFSHDENFNWDLYGLHDIESKELQNMAERVLLSEWQNKDATYPTIYMPNWALGWNPKLIEDSSLARQMLGLSEDSNIVKNLVEYVNNFIQNRTKNSQNQKALTFGQQPNNNILVCMVAPYIDCLWIPTILIVVEDILLDKHNIKVEFKFIEHSDIEQEINYSGKVDIGIATLDQIKNGSSYFFKQIYDKSLSINAAFLSKLKGTNFFELIPFTGSLHKKRVEGRYPDGKKILFDVIDQFEEWEKNYEDRFFNEYFFHLLFSNEIFPEDYASLPTSDGFVWGIDFGLIAPRHQISNASLKFPLQSISCSPTRIESADPILGCIIRNVDKINCEDFLIFLRREVKSHFSDCANKALQLAWDGRIGSPSTSFQDIDARRFFTNADAWEPETTKLVELMMTPIFRANPQYDGNLNRMQPSAFLHNIAFFEKYYDYVPIWQIKLDMLLRSYAEARNNRSTSSNQNIAS